MAAFDPPFIADLMSATPPSHSRNTSVNDLHNDNTSGAFAAFSPSSTLHPPEVTGSQRPTILIHQKSQLLVATPPQITRALAYSHPFLRPLNKLAGLLSWTTDDPWESFILLASFWATILYGDIVLRWAGPVFMVAALMLAMYARRYSMLSSTHLTGEKRKKSHKRSKSENPELVHSSLEDIVETLRLLTSRCNILLSPFLKLTDFLSTQTSATSATTRPALTALFIRIVLVTPVWIILTLPPFYIITTKRVILAVGTTILTWHSQPARVTRTIFWRSRTVRQLCSLITGLNLLNPSSTHSRYGSDSQSRTKTPHEIAASLAARSGRDAPALRFTFALYENQRRWLGIGWTSSLLAYERAPWTDEHLNATASKDQYVPPEVEGRQTRWKWVEGSEWHVVDTNGDIVEHPDDASSNDGWIFYDNKWHNGRTGKDGWNRYTRRRKWCREAELIDISAESSPSLENISAAKHGDSASMATTLVPGAGDGESTTGEDAHSAVKDSAYSSGSADTTSVKKRKPWFGSRRPSQPSSEKSMALSSGAGSLQSVVDYDDNDVHVPLRIKEVDHGSRWGVGDDAEMSFG